MLKKLKQAFKVIGILVLAVGLILQFANLKGWLHHKERIDFLKWIKESQKGMPVNELPAKSFMNRFPPPSNSQPSEITHITKNVIHLENGLIYQAQINYMHRDHSRTNYVATLDDVQKWADESEYPWMVFYIMLIGFIVTLLGLISKQKKKTTKTNQQDLQGEDRIVCLNSKFS